MIPAEVEEISKGVEVCSYPIFKAHLCRGFIAVMMIIASIGQTMRISIEKPPNKTPEGFLRADSDG
jgi:hypothetical protein